nr:MAG TPA: hypothetical protein [Caudoviricetes sp.]
MNAVISRVVSLFVAVVLYIKDCIYLIYKYIYKNICASIEKCSYASK